MLHLLHIPLLQLNPKHEALIWTPEVTIQRLSTFVSNGDPSPTLISSLLTPVVAALYALYEHLRVIKTSDPALKQSVVGLLTTWGRLVEFNTGVNSLWSVISSPRPQYTWITVPDTGIQLIERYVARSGPTICLLLMT